MYTISVDEGEKIVYLEFSNYVGNEEALMAANDFQKIVERLNSDFVIICDISQLRSFARIARLTLQKSMRILNTYTPDKIVRIVDNYVGATLFEKAQQAVNLKQKVIRVASKERALALVKTSK